MSSVVASFSSSDGWLTPERFAKHLELDAQWERDYVQRNPQHMDSESWFKQRAESRVQYFTTLYSRAPPKSATLHERYAPLLGVLSATTDAEQFMNIILCYYYSYEAYDWFAFQMHCGPSYLTIPVDGLPTPKFMEEFWMLLGCCTIYMLEQHDTYTLTTDDQKTMEWIWTWFPTEQRQLWEREWVLDETTATHGAKQLYASFRQYCSLDKAMGRVAIGV